MDRSKKTADSDQTSRYAENSPKVRRKRPLRENCILKGQSARPPVSIASRRTNPYPRRLDATWANVGNPGLCRAGLGGGGRMGDFALLFTKSKPAALRKEIGGHVVSCGPGGDQDIRGGHKQWKYGPRQLMRARSGARQRAAGHVHHL